MGRYRILTFGSPCVTGVVLLLLAGWSCTGLTPTAEGSGAEAIEDSTGQRMRAHVQTLTAPEFAGRGSGTPEVDAAADTIAAWFAELGLLPGIDAGWFQEFPLSGEGFSGRTGRNVIGLLPGSGDLADRFVCVGAHYDHLGRLTEFTSANTLPEVGEYYPGANDNASGVAVLLELARSTSRADDQPRRSVLFAAFGAEEIGLQGSAYLVSHLPVEPAKLEVMINFDTVGQLVENRVYISGVGTSPPLTSLVHESNAEGFDLALNPGGWSGSDHMSFNTREVPVLFVFSGPYPEYNRPEDDWPTLNYEGLAALSRYCTRLLDALREFPAELPYVMITEKQLRPADDSEQNRNTWFGSLPDFTVLVTGYKLGGVFDNSPAARAGLQKGDVVVRLGGQPVTCLNDFTTAMRSHDPGAVVEVEILREQQRLLFTVVLGDRRNR